IRHHRGGLLRTLVVALHDVVPTDRDLADLVRAGRHLVPVTVDEPALDPPDRRADRTGTRVVPRRQERRDWRGLGQPLALLDLDAELGLELVDDLHRQRGATRRRYP